MDSSFYFNSDFMVPNLGSEDIKVITYQLLSIVINDRDATGLYDSGLISM